MSGRLPPVAGKAVSLHQIISCISLFLQEPQNPFDINVPSAQRANPFSSKSFRWTKEILS